MSNQIEYQKVRISILKNIDTFDNDLYIKLSDTKYVKVFNGGEEHFLDWVTHFDSKDIEFLYATDFDDKNLELPMSVALTSVQTNFANFLENLDQHFERFSDMLGVISPSKISIDSIKREIRGLEKELMSYLSKEDKKSINKFYIEHSILTAIFCLEFFSYTDDNTDEYAKKRLVTASLLHDISLFDKKTYFLGREDPDNIIIKNEEYFQTSEYQNHTKDSALIAKSLGIADRQILKIIYMHHERPMRRGFPSGTDLDTSYHLPLIFVLAHDAVRAIYKNDFNEISLNELFHYINEKNQDSHHVRVFIDKLQDAMANRLL